MPIVYMATNTVNGKRYIGASRFSLEKRKSQHLANARDPKRMDGRLYPALRKYGADKFVWTVLKTYNNSHEMFAGEIALIAELAPEYNVSSGGEGSRGTKMPHGKSVICLEDNTVFRTITAAAAHYSACLADMQRVLKKPGSVRGKHFTYYTEPLSEEERQQAIADIEKAKWLARKLGGKNHAPVVSDGKDILGRSAAGPMKNARSVACITTGEEFVSARAAASFYEVSHTAVTELCLKNPRRKTVGGLVFEYIDSRQQRAA